MLTQGTGDLFRYDPAESGGYFDAQTRAWFDGHWDVPREEIGIEAFVIDGRHYQYFGPVPSLLRVPVLALTDRFDHRLGAVSMLGASGVLMAAAIALSWRVREQVRGPGTPVSRSDLVGAFAFTALLGGGSTVLFLASRSWAYHEAMLWAVAFTTAAFVVLLDLLTTFRVRTLALATLFATCAIGTRASVGVAAVVVLAGGGAAALAAAAARRLDGTSLEGASRPLAAPARWLRCPHLPAGPTLLAALVPVVTYSAVNLVKFGSLFRLPVERQIYLNQSRPARLAALADNGGSLFGVKFLPTNLFHYLRPDAFALDRLFPFITFPRHPPTRIGNVTFDGLQPASSLTVTMPLFVIVAAVGLVVILRRRGNDNDPGPASSRLLVIGGIAATLSGLCIAWSTQRYHADFLPLLLVTALVGLHHLLGRWSTEGATRWWRRRAPRVVLAVVALATVWVNVSLALLVQHTLLVQSTGRAGFVAFQQGIDERLFGDPPVHVRQVDELPDGAAPGDLAIVGDCEGLYQSIGAFQAAGQPARTWRAVERTAATGGFAFTLTPPDVRPAEPEPLLVSGSAGNRMVLGIDYVGDDEARIILDVEGTGERFEGDPFPFAPGESQAMSVVFDRRTLEVTVDLDDRRVFGSPFWRPEPDPTITVGSGGIDGITAPRYTGTLVVEPLGTPVCDDLRARQDGS